ncbi:hypothetical protein ILP92_12390 [Maribius pontilimi]|uniref:Uncharacterized protein n=1 Tax=Palleronia pontilimi TaxID=1964209 RepID=A0A934MEK9_9RHOB|nr:hypothetical protein [Palleronia pontilimi]MBJ3763546.1 hypothetical protein [Palleronia pontilimi]
MRISDRLVLFHLALHDQDIADARLVERIDGGTHESLNRHVKGRLNRFDEVNAATPAPGDPAIETARAQLASPRPGRVRTRVGHIAEGANVERGILIEIPARFAEVL